MNHKRSQESKNSVAGAWKAIGWTPSSNICEVIKRRMITRMSCRWKKKYYACAANKFHQVFEKDESQPRWHWREKAHTKQGGLWAQTVQRMRASCMWWAPQRKYARTSENYTRCKYVGLEDWGKSWYKSKTSVTNQVHNHKEHNKRRGNQDAPINSSSRCNGIKQ